MTEQELIAQITKAVYATLMPVSPLSAEGKKINILALIKEAGWIDPKNIVMPGEFGTPKAKEILAEWAKANGYVKLNPDQIHRLETCSGHHL